MKRHTHHRQPVTVPIFSWNRKIFGEVLLPCLLPGRTLQGAVVGLWERGDNCAALFLNICHKFISGWCCRGWCRVHMENFIRPSSAAGTRRAVGDNGYVALHTLLHSGLSGLQLKVCGGECNGDLEKENTWTYPPLPPICCSFPLLQTTTHTQFNCPTRKGCLILIGPQQ